jgi:hypothetical protein
VFVGGAVGDRRSARETWKARPAAITKTVQKAVTTRSPPPLTDSEHVPRLARIIMRKDGSEEGKHA